MSKYIVDIDDFEPLFKVDSIGVFGIGKSLSYSEEDHSWSRIKSIEEFEELNSDYINEHYGELQDEAYERGLEDGKWKAEDGCTGRKYEGNAGEHLPREYCMNNFKNQWTAKQKDRIEVGDFVRSNEFRDVVVCVTYVDAAWKNFSGFAITDTNVCRKGHTFASCRMDRWHKTGEHFDIEPLWKGES